MDNLLERTDALLGTVRGIDQRLVGSGFEGVSGVARLFEQLHKALAAVSIQEIDATLADIDRTRRAFDSMSRDLGRLRLLKQSLGDGLSSGT